MDAPDQLAFVDLRIFRHKKQGGESLMRRVTTFLATAAGTGLSGSAWSALLVRFG
jgi:hypothetical protein